MNLVFLDASTPRPYSHIGDCPGGTEMTVVRVANGLAARGHRVTVAQRGRKTCTTGFLEVDGPSVRFAPIDPMWVPETADALVVLRRPEVVRHARRLCDAKKVFLWCHDFNHDQIAAHIDDLAAVHLIAVSRHHANVIIKACPSKIVSYIYPPIDDDLQPESTFGYDSFKLLFACSPHKGLERALEAFREIRRRDSRFKLFVTNPGYYQTVAVNDPGVTVIGTLTHADNLKEMRSSFCLLHPNDVYAETFGLVHAEANAVGTPVIAVAIGATPELVSSEQLVSKFDLDEIADRVIGWHRIGRPKVSALSRFRLSSVLDEWEDNLRDH